MIPQFLERECRPSFPLFFSFLPKHTSQVIVRLVFQISRGHAERERRAEDEGLTFGGGCEGLERKSCVGNSIGLPRWFNTRPK